MVFSLPNYFEDVYNFFLLFKTKNIIYFKKRYLFRFEMSTRSQLIQ